jgi:hypothetical protein
MNFAQNTFSGGMDYYDKDTDIDWLPTYTTTRASSYKLGINCRNRGGKLEAIQTPVDITFNLNGNPQGVYSFGNVIISFYSGRAYYQVPGMTTWRRVPQLQLDTTVPIIYAEAVTGITNNFLRSAVPAVVGGVTQANSAGGIILTPALFISGTPAGIICQDGINQPWIITYDPVNNIATSRLLGTYNTWNNDPNNPNSREYVPIGTKMRFHPSGILFLLAPDGTTIYRSVSGRPCDFMINIDTNGNKLATEALGGAGTTSFAVDFDTVNIISVGDSQTIQVGTPHNFYGMTLNYTSTIFGEPTFTKAYQIQSGVVNHQALTYSLQDTVFIDYDGIKSFNEVNTLKFKGLEGPFSKNISQLFIYSSEGIKYPIVQNVCAAANYDDYCLFSVKTKFGYCVAVYDALNSVWVSIDINEATIDGVQMFATLLTPTTTYCVCQTQRGKIYSLFANSSNTRCQASLFTAAITSGTFFAEIKTNSIKVALENNLLPGTMFVREFVDEERGQELAKPIKGVTSGMNFPLRFPFSFDNTSRMQNIVYPFNQGITGTKLSYLASWSSDCSIYGYEVYSTGVPRQQSQKENP